MPDSKDPDNSLKKTEELLRKSEVRYKLLVDAVSDYAIFMLSPEGIIETWNKGAEILKGYNASEIIGKHFSIFYTPTDLDIDSPNQELINANKNGRYEEQGYRVRKDGSTFYANVIINAL